MPKNAELNKFAFRKIKYKYNPERHHRYELTLNGRQVNAHVSSIYSNEDILQWRCSLQGVYFCDNIKNPNSIERWDDLAEAKSFLDLAEAKHFLVEIYAKKNKID